MLYLPIVGRIDRSARGRCPWLDVQFFGHVRGPLTRCRGTTVFDVAHLAIRAVAVAALGVLLVSCSPPATSTTTPAGTEATGTTTPKTDAVPGPTPTPAATTLVRERTAFSSPTDNIHCSLEDTFVRCDVAERTYTLPTRPASCRLDWGSVLVLPMTGSSQFDCVGDSIGPTPLRLGYGKAIRAGDLACSMAEAGITCKQLKNGHGFFLSRASYRQF